MNNARQLYLIKYSRIDTINTLIQKCGFKYISWKYCHSSKRLCEALNNVVAFSFYGDCDTEMSAVEVF